MTNDQKLPFLIFGAGAIGTYIGGSLALAGHQVHYLEKERDIPLLKQQGLHLTLGENKHHLTGVDFFDSLAILERINYQLAILALKTYHLEAILPELIKFRDILPPVLCLQNGVEGEKRLADALGDQGVIPGTVTSAVDRLDKGKIKVQKRRGMGIAGDHPRVNAFQQAFNQAALNCRVYATAEGMKWSKLIINLLGNASSAILDLTPSAIYAHPGLFRMELEQIREGFRVMRKGQIPTVNLPGVPVNLLAAAVKTLPGAVSQSVLSSMIGKGRGEKMPSFHIDLHSGRGQTEVNALNGAVVRAGEHWGVPTPVNRFLTNRLLRLNAGEIPLDKYHNKPDLLLQELESN